MHNDFVPDSAKNLRDWTQNLLDHIDPVATRLAWPAATLAAFKALLQRLLAAAQAQLDAQAALDTAQGQLLLARQETLPEVRQSLNHLKATRGWTEGDGQALDVITSSSTLNRGTYRPQLEAEARRGHVLLTGKKLGATSLNLYWRRKGETTWRLLAAKRVRFPFDDQTPPATPGALEEREYQAIGVLGDDEFGQPSQIATAVFQP